MSAQDHASWEVQLEQHLRIVEGLQKEQHPEEEGVVSAEKKKCLHWSKTSWLSMVVHIEQAIQIL